MQVRKNARGTGTHRKGGDDEQDVGDNTNSGSDANGLEATPLGVGDDATDDGQEVCKRRKSRVSALLFVGAGEEETNRQGRSTKAVGGGGG